MFHADFVVRFHDIALLHFPFSQLDVTEGTPDLGVTSYWTDAEGNVVFGPNTPKDKLKTSVVGAKTQKRKGNNSMIPI